MPIASSQIVEDRAQRDGRRWVRERHADHLGAHHECLYLAEPGADAAAAMAARVAVIEARLAVEEIERDIAFILEGNYAAVTARHASLADVRAALRAFYATATGQAVGRMAGYLLTLTDAQLRTLFAMTQTQVNQLRTRLQARFDALNAVLAATGE